MASLGLSSEEIADLKAQLEFRGVRGIDPSVAALAPGGVGADSAKGLTHIVQAFRGQRKNKRKEGVQPLVGSEQCFGTVPVFV